MGCEHCKRITAIIEKIDGRAMKVVNKGVEPPPARQLVTEDEWMEVYKEAVSGRE